MKSDDAVSDVEGPAAGGEPIDASERAHRAARGHQILASLAVPDFRVLWLGTMGSYFAMQMLTVARSYLAYSIGNSAIALGVVNLAWGLPLLFVAPFSGAIIDRVEKRSLLLAAQLLLGVGALAIAILVATGRVELWHLVASALVEGVVLTFNFPVRQAIIPELVGKARLSNAIALTTVGSNLSRIAGPAIAGALIGAPWFGMSNTYFLVAGIYAFVVFTVSQLPRIQSLSAGPRESIFESIGTGVRYLGRDTRLIRLMGLAIVPVALGLSYQALLPVYSKEILGLGAEGLGQLYAMVGVGALLGSLAVASFSTLDDKGAMQLASGAVFGLSLALVALSREFWLALVLLLVLGASSQSYITINNALITWHTPRELLGRIMSLFLLTFSIQPLAVFPISALADEIGVSATLCIAGSLILAFIFSVYALDRRRRA